MARKKKPVVFDPWAWLQKAMDDEDGPRGLASVHLETWRGDDWWFTTDGHRLHAVRVAALPELPEGTPVWSGEEVSFSSRYPEDDGVLVCMDPDLFTAAGARRTSLRRCWQLGGEQESEVEVWTLKTLNGFRVPDELLWAAIIHGHAAPGVKLGRFNLDLVEDALACGADRMFVHELGQCLFGRVEAADAMALVMGMGRG